MNVQYLYVKSKIKIIYLDFWRGNNIIKNEDIIRI